MRIALFVTCLGDTLYPETGRAVVTVLERLGHEVVFPAEQTCCGQLHANSGYPDEAIELVRRFESIFGSYDAVVSPSSSCVGHVRELAPELAPRVFELSELLVNRLGVEDVGASFPQRVVYHPTCHSLRVTKVGDAPLRLLRNVRGLELVPLERAEECCGFGGTFAVKNAATSSAILADKCDAIEASGAGYCTAVDGSCLLQIGGGLERRSGGVRALHLAEILAATEGA
ncbi:MAG: L-lactate dehydrogenase complex protein LldE [Gaiellaceae bacterium]|jgi:L-lactate dehydrogenase complex protein LldE|nr:L-lactate dehydrogenase complex protein LldE [Gaiellaceae bacterium]